MKYITAKTILSKNKTSDWFGAQYCINLYRGCCHGCIYCDSRSSCYQDVEFSTVKPKKNAIEILQKELSSKNSVGIIDTGAMGDPYNPFERDLNLTRQFLCLALKYGFGVSITTKSSLIERDIDLLKRISRNAPVICEITITTKSDKLCGIIEPFADSSSRRFKTIRTLTDSGLFAGVVLMPVLPFLEDNMNNILGIVENANAAGAKFIYPYFGVTLRHNQREWYYNKLQQRFGASNLVARYEKEFGNQYECISPKAQILQEKFEQKCREYNILYDMQEIIYAYSANYAQEQLSLF